MLSEAECELPSSSDHKLKDPKYRTKTRGGARPQMRANSQYCKVHVEREAVLGSRWILLGSSDSISGTSSKRLDKFQPSLY